MSTIEKLKTQRDAAQHAAALEAAKLKARVATEAANAKGTRPTVSTSGAKDTVFGVPIGALLLGAIAIVGVVVIVIARRH